MNVYLIDSNQINTKEFYDFLSKPASFYKNIKKIFLFHKENEKISFDIVDLLIKSSKLFEIEFITCDNSGDFLINLGFNIAKKEPKDVWISFMDESIAPTNVLTKCGVTVKSIKNITKSNSNPSTKKSSDKIEEIKNSLDKEDNKTKEIKKDVNKQKKQKENINVSDENNEIKNNKKIISNSDNQEQLKKIKLTNSALSMYKKYITVNPDDTKYETDDFYKIIAEILFQTEDDNLLENNLVKKFGTKIGKQIFIDIQDKTTILKSMVILA